MNIIIEGPDATGKTTLSEKLQKKYNLDYMHLTSSTPNDLQFHMNLLDKDNMIYDRFMCGELVYPKIYNREPKMNLEDVYKIMNKIIDNNDIFIIMYASDINTLKERLIERGETDYLKEIEEQNILFKQVIYMLNVFEYKNFITIDVSNLENYNKLDKFIDDNIKKNTLNRQYRQVCRDLLNNGNPIKTKTGSRGASKELNNYMFKVDDIEDNIVTLKTRDISLPYLVGEMLWYWQSRNDTEFIGKFAPLWKNITDDGITNNSAYGYILQEKYGFNQIETIIKLLQDDPTSRRAVLNINVPNLNVEQTHDEPCTIALNLFIRDGKLNCTGIMRSNDVIFGLTYDITYFTQIQKYIASRLNIPTGSYTHFATSMHFYDKDYEKIIKIANGNLETIDNRVNLDLLLSDTMINTLNNYIDNEFVNKKEFENKCKQLSIIKKRGL